jgi:hypothetical protein
MPRRDLTTFRNNRTRSDNRSFTNLGTIKDDGANANHCTITNRRPVHDGGVTDRYVLTDSTRMAGIGMQYRQVLDIGSCSDFDPLGVATYHRAEPNTDTRGDLNLTTNGSVGGNEYIVADQVRVKAGVNLRIGHYVSTVIKAPQFMLS